MQGISQRSQMTQSSTMQIAPENVVKAARRVTWVGFWINAALGLLKILAGVFGRSSAMIADGVHSFSDFISDIIVIIFVGVSHRQSNNSYQYGHGKYETFATMILATILLFVAVTFFTDGVGKTWDAIRGCPLPRPTWLALGMAILSILSKEWLYHYTRHVGETIQSSVVIANAWHHRSDALSSIATLAGIAGAMYLGEQWRVLDPIAAIIVSIFIFIVAIRIGKPAVEELLEASLPASTVNEIYDIISSTPGVKTFHRFASRRNGTRMILDFHIKVNPNITVEDGHTIATDVEHRLKAHFEHELTVNIHVEPYHGTSEDENKMYR